jgi:Sec-independent protein secretion pathway component TatC
MTLLMMARDMRAMNPSEPQFWFVMSVAVIAGFATAYPINLWLVAKNLKHGLMTERRPRAAVRAARVSTTPAAAHGHLGGS